MNQSIEKILELPFMEFIEVVSAKLDKNSPLAEEDWEMIAIRLRGKDELSQDMIVRYRIATDIYSKLIESNSEFEESYTQAIFLLSAKLIVLDIDNRGKHISFVENLFNKKVNEPVSSIVESCESIGSGEVNLERIRLLRRIKNFIKCIEPAEKMLSGSKLESWFKVKDLLP
ncbi:hypothetical protein [Aliikangiella sp. IMCC44632]